ncbi:hypothetical protein D1007_40226 [Hordeum vulgare]|nr:hypothetical protein D1007_40226 [Hordeum vulgare]
MSALQHTKQVEKLMWESRDANEAAAKIMELCAAMGDGSCSAKVTPERPPGILRSPRFVATSEWGSGFMLPNPAPAPGVPRKTPQRCPMLPRTKEEVTIITTFKTSVNHLGTLVTCIVSSISFSPQNGMLAVVSYSQTTVVYAEDDMEPLYVLHGQLGSVTQVLFSKDGNYLYNEGRKDPYILCWGIRNTVDIVYKTEGARKAHQNSNVVYELSLSFRG